MTQYIILDWFVTKEDLERAEAYAERNGLSKPCDLMEHLLDLAISKEATGERVNTVPTTVVRVDNEIMSVTQEEGQ